MVFVDQLLCVVGLCQFEKFLVVWVVVGGQQWEVGWGSWVGQCQYGCIEMFVQFCVLFWMDWYVGVVQYVQLFFVVGCISYCLYVVVGQCFGQWCVGCVVEQEEVEVDVGVEYDVWSVVVGCSRYMILLVEKVYVLQFI